MTVRDEVAAAADRLAAAGVPAARADAEQLAAHALGVARSALALTSFSPAQRETFRSYVDRRASREPLQHIVGSVGFRHVVVAVGPGVFVPRPETELVAGAAVAAARPGARVVDLCAGSGAIALAVAAEVPGAEVHAVELDPAALEWLRRNASGTPVTVHAGDAVTALGELDGTVDVVVSNPPYVAAAALDGTEPEVREHDPRPALVSGADGLDLIRALVGTAYRLLRPGGVFVVEHGDDHGEAVPALLRAAGGWRDVADHRDYAGRPRYTTATKEAR